MEPRRSRGEVGAGRQGGGVSDAGDGKDGTNVSNLFAEAVAATFNPQKKLFFSAKISKCSSFDSSLKLNPSHISVV